MTRDPVIDAIAVRIQRLVLFVFIALMGWLLLWVMLLQEVGQVGVWSLLAVTRLALPPASNEWFAVVFWQDGAIAFLVTTVLYLLVALWWKAQGDVHRRGTRFINARGEN